VIAGFLAQGMPVDMAVVAAVYVHGMAGDMAAENAGEIGLLASDVIDQLPKVINILHQSK
jgi:NAD(P)H-hydrate epimerase